MNTPARLMTWVLFFLSMEIFGQTRASYFDQPGEVVVPARLENGRKYPLVVFLPFTGGSASRFYERHETYLPADDLIVMLPAGTPGARDYLPNFMDYVGWYEERLTRDLRRVLRDYPVDPERVVLAGFSLGGDLAWALSLRQPDLFSGFVAAGTRMSYPPPRGSLSSWKNRGFRAVFFTGDREDPNRLNGIRYARNLVRDAGIEFRYREVDGGHVSGPPRDIAEAILWALEPR